MQRPTVLKATAVLTREGLRGRDVLVFDHPLDEGGFMVQLPAGTIEPGEDAALAAVRELFEETGVKASPGALAGVLDEVWEGEPRRRWVYLLDALADLPDEWPYHCAAVRRHAATGCPSRAPRSLHRNNPGFRWRGASSWASAPGSAA